MATTSARPSEKRGSHLTLRALATVGIQAGHMKLHSRNMAVTAGARDDEVETVVEMVRASGERITATAIESALAKLRNE